jgi:hypothetical protein
VLGDSAAMIVRYLCLGEFTLADRVYNEANRGSAVGGVRDMSVLGGERGTAPFAGLTSI